jgi:hypothetical protein
MLVLSASIPPAGRSEFDCIGHRSTTKKPLILWKANGQGSRQIRVGLRFISSFPECCSMTFAKEKDSMWKNQILFSSSRHAELAQGEQKR